MLRITILLIAGLAGLGVLLLAIGAALDPTSSSFALVGALVWTTIGPHLLLASALALLVAALAHRRNGGKFSKLVLVVDVLALLSSGLIVGSIVRAATAAGGSVDLAGSLLLGKMTLPKPDADEVFASPEGEDLHAAVYRPSQSDRPAPIAVYIHGGGFMSGTNTETAADLRWLADHGLLVISVDYRTFKPGKPTWDKATPDATCGLVWAAANAKRYGGDADRIVLLGDSAGGNLAINIGFAAKLGHATSLCAGTVPVPMAIVVQYPAVDPVKIYERGFPIPGFEPAMLMNGYVGGPPEQYPERIKAISSESFITADAPPTLIVEPEKDSLVVSESVYAFAAKAQAAGVNLRLVRIPYANHIYNQIAANSLGNQASRTIRLNFIEDVLR